MSVRVLQAMAGARHGGAEAFFTRLATALSRAGQDQHILIRRDADRCAALRQAGLAPVELRFGGPLDLFSRHAFRREVAAYRPELVLTWMSRATAACPTGGFVHAGRLGGYYDLKYYRRCDHLIGNTPDIVDYIVREGWPAERAHYLPNFVSDRTAPPVSREALQTPAGAPLLMALGRLHENKAFDILLDALSELPTAHLWLLGDGPLEASLQAQCKRLGLDQRVRFVGWQADPTAYYAAADLIVCPSRIEPLGNVVVEAWAQSKPIVAAAVQGPAFLIDDGVSGLLVPPDDATALAAGIARVLESKDLGAALAAGGRERYEAEFTEARVVAQYQAFFDGTVGR